VKGKLKALVEEHISKIDPVEFSTDAFTARVELACKIASNLIVVLDKAHDSSLAIMVQVIVDETLKHALADTPESVCEAYRCMTRAWMNSGEPGKGQFFN
jgi:hypothetical protein